MDAGALHPDFELVDDAALQDAAMIDPTIDELFGEAADELAVALPSAPPPPELILRVAEMQSRGCSAKVAWSRSGSIALVSKDGMSASFRVLTTARKTGEAILNFNSKDLIHAPEGRRFVHCQFSSYEMDLALVDDVGVPHMYTHAAALGKLTAVPSESSVLSDPVSEQNVIVGMHWLPVWPQEFRPGSYISPSIRVGNKWHTQIVQRDLAAPKVCNPAEQKLALLHVSRIGRLTLMYQNEGNAWQSTSLMLETLTSSDDLISHADIAADKSDLLVVTRSYASRLRLYRVTINWNATEKSRQMPNAPPNPASVYHVVAPTLDLSRLATVANAQLQQLDGAALTHLRIVPSLTPGFGTVDTVPFILAVYTYASWTNTSSPPFSVIARWTIDFAVPVLHESFKTLKPGGTVATMKHKIARLKREPDLSPTKVILSVELQSQDSLLVFTNSDGSVELRDRVTMEPSLPPFGEVETIGNLVQAGFDHVTSEHSIHCALSPDASAIVHLSPDHTLRAQLMSFRLDWHAGPEEFAANMSMYDSAAAGIARQYAFLCVNFLSVDELLMLYPVTATVDIRESIMRNIMLILRRTNDILMADLKQQQMVVLREPLFPRVYSAQLGLYTNHHTGHRSFAGQFAFVVLHLRHGFGILSSLLGKIDGSKLGLDIAQSLLRQSRWVLDLVVYIFDTLLSLKRRVTTGAHSADVVAELINQSGSPAVHLLLCSIPRSLLRFCIIMQNRFYTLLDAAVPRATDLNQRQELQDALNYYARLPLKLSQLEALSLEIETGLRADLGESGLNLSAQERNEFETTMCLTGAIPGPFANALDTLLGPRLDKFMDASDTDMAGITFWSSSWIGLESIESVQYDAIRKTPLKQGVVLKLCRRCGARTEDLSSIAIPSDVHSFGPDLRIWLANANTQRHCVCMNYWIVDPDTEKYRKSEAAT